MQGKRTIKHKTPGKNASRRPALIVMAKTAAPGKVKTRLTPPLTADQAAAVHQAMLDCVLARLAGLAAQHDFEAVLATTGDLNAQGWRSIDQGDGDLGERIARVWQMLGHPPAAFFGVDSPDLPGGHLRAVADVLTSADPVAAIGPVGDGGYWTLAATKPTPALLSGIDWGTSSVYHQTHERAVAAGVTLTDLPAWHDVDDFNDLDALLQRSAKSDDPDVRRLETTLRPICEGAKP